MFRRVKATVCHASTQSRSIYPFNRLLTRQIRSDRTDIELVLMAFDDVRLRSLSGEFVDRLMNARGRYDRSLNGYEMTDTGV